MGKQRPKANRNAPKGNGFYHKVKPMNLIELAIEYRNEKNGFTQNQNRKVHNDPQLATKGGRADSRLLQGKKGRPDTEAVANPQPKATAQARP
jgi:hypothetical protein